jgi:hypothetical protein
MKEKALTGGGLSVCKVQGEVSRGHSSWGKRADQEKIEIR